MCVRRHGLTPLGWRSTLYNSERGKLGLWGLATSTSENHLAQSRSNSLLVRQKGLKILLVLVLVPMLMLVMLVLLDLRNHLPV